MAPNKPKPRPPRPTAPRLFAMYRHEDVNGRSGTGVAAWGVQWPDGRVMTWWAASRIGVHQIEWWNNLREVVDTHGHGARSRLIWLGATTAAEQVMTAPLWVRYELYAAALRQARPGDVNHLALAMGLAAELPAILASHDSLAAAYARQTTELEALRAEHSAQQAHLEAMGEGTSSR